jgi:hypothetical protein
MNDSAGAGALIATDSDLGKLLGGLLLALAAIATFWLNLKLTGFAAAILGGQVGGMLALASSARAGRAPGAPVPSDARDALSAFGARVSGAVRGAARPLAESGCAGAMLVRAGGGASALASGGMLGVGSRLAKRGAAGVGHSSLGHAIGGTKAGALATRMARAGHSGWKAAGRQQTVPPPAASEASVVAQRQTSSSLPERPAPSATRPARPTTDPPPAERGRTVTDGSPSDPGSATQRRYWRPPSRPAGAGESSPPRPSRRRRWRRKGR